MSLAIPGTAWAEIPGWPSSVTAKYEISFAGIQVGYFVFESNVDGGGYALRGKGKVSALFGAFKWNGKTQSSGHALKDAPDPRAFSFEFRANKKHGAVRMAMLRRRVTQLEVRPNRKRRSRRLVPLRQEHMRGVFDPLSAIMALTRTTGRKPCDQTIPVFDGRQRFDLRLQYAGRERGRGRGRNGARPPGFVCKVKYVPIGGYKRNRSTRFIAQSNGIRVTLRPVPSAGVSIPAEVRLPVIAGDAVMSLKRVVITTDRNQRIAMNN